MAIITFTRPYWNDIVEWDDVTKVGRISEGAGWSDWQPEPQVGAAERLIEGGHWLPMVPIELRLTEGL